MLPPHKSDAIVENLARKGVVVRSCRSFAGLPDHYIRVSVGERLGKRVVRAGD